MTDIRIYFEGHKSLRPGFKTFFAEIDKVARQNRIAFHVIPGNGASQTKADHRLALESHPNAWNILLLDSEGAEFDVGHSTFWMVQLMEAWFLADRATLAKYYGRDFRENALRQNPRVEEIPKADVLESLKRATRETQKGEYNKTAHAPHLLELLDEAKVRHAAPNCDLLFREILQAINATVR